jgi:hypothetical protein
MDDLSSRGRGRDPSYAKALELFGRLIGSWKMDITSIDPDGGRRSFVGECHFGWDRRTGRADVVIARSPSATWSGAGARCGRSISSVGSGGSSGRIRSLASSVCSSLPSWDDRSSSTADGPSRRSPPSRFARRATSLRTTPTCAWSKRCRAGAFGTPPDAKLARLRRTAPNPGRQGSRSRTVGRGSVSALVRCPCLLTCR